MKLRHLVAALLAVGLFLLALHATRASEDAVMDTLALNWRALEHNTVTFQRAAVARPDLLLVFGSSEIYQDRAGHASTLFARYPSGFTVFPIALSGTGPLTFVSEVAALGPNLSGKKVVVSVTPDSFMEPTMPIGSFRAGYWPPRLYELAFHPTIGFDVKRDVARLILDVHQYQALVTDPFLRFTLERLADGSSLSRLAYYALWPLGQARIALYRLQDEWHAVTFLRSKLGTLEQPDTRTEWTIPWPALLADADRRARSHAKNNPFGFETQYWKDHGKELLARQGSVSDDLLRQQLDSAQAWPALDALLRALHDMDADTLLITPPFPGAYYDFLGTTAAGREAYYRRMRDLAQTHGARFLDLSGYEGEEYFSVDRASHPSPKGWLILNRALDAFYHDEPLDVVYQLLPPATPPQD